MKEVVVQMFAKLGWFIKRPTSVPKAYFKRSLSVRKRTRSVTINVRKAFRMLPMRPGSVRVRVYGAYSVSDHDADGSGQLWMVQLIRARQKDEFGMHR
jgi:hypothetical protein